MINTMRKFLLFFVVMIFFVPQEILAGETFDYNGINYKINGDNTTVSVATNKGLTGEVVIPGTVVYNKKYYSVTSIDSNAFRWECTGLTSITIPSSVTSIGSYAFEGCTGLTSIIVDKNNQVYDSRNNCNAIIKTATNTLLYGCKNTWIPNSVTSIGSQAFERCTGLTSIVIPISVSSIGSYVFSCCSGLTSIEIPSSVTSIGDSPFLGCTGLASIIVDKNNQVYDSRNNCNAIIETATNKLLCGCKNTTIPDDVTIIRNQAFEGCTGLNSINIPNKVTSIERSAFSGCSGLTSITIPSSVILIDDFAFSGCIVLPSITIPSSVTSIGALAFSGCWGLKSMEILSNDTSIGWSAFQECTELRSVTSMIKDPTKEDLDPTKFLDENLDYDNCKLIVPCDKITVYQNAEGWKKFKNIDCRIVSADSQSAEHEFKDMVYVQDKNIMVEGLSSDNYSIYNTAGKQVSNPVPASGVYVVKVGDEAVKVMVK